MSGTGDQLCSVQTNERETNLEQRLNLGGNLAGAGEEEPELVLVGGHQAGLRNVDRGGGHGWAGGVDEGELVGHRGTRSGLPCEVNVVDIRRNHLDIILLRGDFDIFDQGWN